MIIRKKNVEISIGKAVGHVLEDIIVSAKKRLWIVSPWLSPKYAEFLVKKKESGVDVKLITTNDYENSTHKDSLKILVEKRMENVIKNTQLLLWSAVILLVFGFVSSIGEILVVGIPSLLIGGILLTLSLWKKTVFLSKIPLTIIDRFSDFTHSKIYLIDDRIGVIGSANLTESGFWKNIESLTVIKSEKLVKKLTEVYKLLEEHPLKKIVPIEEVGKIIYKEAKGIKETLGEEIKKITSQ